MQNGPSSRWVIEMHMRVGWGGGGGIEGAASALSSSLPGVWMYNEATTRRHHGPTGRAGFKPVVLQNFKISLHFLIWIRKLHNFVLLQKIDASMKKQYLSAKDPFKPVVLPTPVRATDPRPVGGFQNRFWFSPPWVEPARLPTWDKDSFCLTEDWGGGGGGGGRLTRALKCSNVSSPLLCTAFIRNQPWQHVQRIHLDISYFRESWWFHQSGRIMWVDHAWSWLSNKTIDDICIFFFADSSPIFTFPLFVATIVTSYLFPTVLCFKP